MFSAVSLLWIILMFLGAFALDHSLKVESESAPQDIDPFRLEKWKEGRTQ